MDNNDLETMSKPDLLAEVTALTATNNSLVDTCRGLREQVDRLDKRYRSIEATALKIATQRDTAQAHAASLAGALGRCTDVIFGEFAVGHNVIGGVAQEPYALAMAALARYRETQGEVTHGSSDEKDSDTRSPEQQD